MSVVCVVLYSMDQKRTRVEGRVQDGAIVCKLECSVVDGWIKHTLCRSVMGSQLLLNT
jgi:hypothetical protein